MMADVSQILLPECYRGSSPRSASTPGPAAPDSPANSASGRFSASPSVIGSLLSPSFAAANCFVPSYHYSPYHHHSSSQHPSALGLMGSFLSVGQYGPYAALAAAAAAAAAAGMTGQLSQPLAPPPSHSVFNRPKQSLPSSHHPVSRVLPFSVENILKPDFGRALASSPESTPASTATVNEQETLKDVKPLNKEATNKRGAVTAVTAANSPSNKRVKLTPDSSLLKSKKTALVTIKTDPADLSGRSSSCTDSSSSSGETSMHGNSKDTDDGPAELPTDPTKMTDPSKWPAWIFCTRYSDRPSSGPRLRRTKKEGGGKAEEKRPRTAFTSEQLARLKNEFTANRYLNEKRRQELANELQLHENQIKIWFQNKRAKIKKTTGQKNPLALQLMAQGLYNHSTVPLGEEDEDDEMYTPRSQQQGEQGVE